MKDTASIAETLVPPYYAVIFTSMRTDVEGGYQAMAGRMAELASEQPGFLGMESARENGFGITVSYWASEEAIVHWKQDLEHLQAQALGQRAWYSEYKVRVARVERDYSFEGLKSSAHGLQEAQ